MPVSIRARIRTILLVQAALALAVAAILWLTSSRMEREMGQAALAATIQKGVYELSLLTQGYIAHGDPTARDQWRARYDSLRALVQSAVPDTPDEQEHVAAIVETTEDLGALFGEMENVVHRWAESSGREAAILREATERLAARLVARGHEMAGHAVLLTSISNAHLSRARREATLLVVVSVLLALGVSALLFMLLHRAIMVDIRGLERATGIIAAGNLAHRVASGRTEELGRLGEAFNTMTARREQVTRDREALVEKLLASNRELEEFAFVASHDLQEPLRKIRTFGDLLARRQAGVLDPSARDYLARMQAAAERMQGLIHALLQYSRLTTKNEEVGTVDLGALVQEVLSDLSPRIAETGARLSVGGLPRVVASPVQMRQLFQNLVGNSLKFRGDAAPEIRISARLFADAARTLPDPRGSWVEIRVDDNGIGIDPRYLDRLFQPFVRLHGRDRYEGTGMGLAICRKIVERHGGTIEATSAPGRGAAFIVTLPLCRDGGGDGEATCANHEPT